MSLNRQIPVEKKRKVGIPAFFSAQVTHSQRFYFDLNPPSRSLTVICGGLERCATNYAIHRPDGFPYLCLEYVADGTGLLQIGGGTHDISAGHVFAYGPGTALHIVTSEAHPLTKYFICFSGMRGLALLRSAGLPPGAVRSVFPAYGLEKLFEETIEDGTIGGPRGQELCTALLRSMVLKLAAGAVAPNRAQFSAFETFRRCRRYMEEQFLDLNTQAQVARACRIDPAYLCRLFQTYDYQSPYQFLMRLKIHHAATLLQHSDCSVKQAAMAVGFPDQLHFSRVFRKFLGIAPTALKTIR